MLLDTRSAEEVGGFSIHTRTVPFKDDLASCSVKQKEIL